MKGHRVAFVAAICALPLLAACSTNEVTATGTFKPLKSATSEYQQAGGTAEVKRSTSGTKARIELTNFPPDHVMLGHLHAGACTDSDPGGAHFRFDPNGGEAPPNEIHFNITTDSNGSATVSTTNKSRVPDGAAKSIVIHMGVPKVQAQGMALNGDGHTTHSHLLKVACADL